VHVAEVKKQRRWRPAVKIRGGRKTPLHHQTCMPLPSCMNDIMHEPSRTNFRSYQKTKMETGMGLAALCTHLVRFITEPSLESTARGLGKEFKVSRYTQIRAEVVA
jgi:hypothetical protein